MGHQDVLLLLLLSLIALQLLQLGRSFPQLRPKLLFHLSEVAINTLQPLCLLVELEVEVVDLFSLLLQLLRQGLDLCFILTGRRFYLEAQLSFLRPPLIRHIALFFSLFLKRLLQILDLLLH